MNVYTYDIPVVKIPESNFSYINKRLIRVVECEDIVPEEFLNLWNYNLCSQDDYYCQPWLRGDKVYFQFRVTDPTVQKVYPVLVNSANDQNFYPAGAISYTLANDTENGWAYANVILDTTNIDVNCFYIKLNFYKEAVDQATFDACVAAAMGGGQDQFEAIYNCLASLVSSENIVSKVSEPYCEEICGRSTLLIKGEYLKYDCNLNWYGVFQAGIQNAFIPQLRVYGEIVNEGFTFTETMQNNKKKSSKQISTWAFRTPKIPPYVAEQIAVCFNSKKLTINGAEFRKASEISKNNEDGNMWIINTQLTTECDEINFTCS